MTEARVDLARGGEPGMSRVAEFCWNLAGKKAVLAVTGLALYGWIVAHMLGNLLIFLGPATYNGYAAFLKGAVELLWAERAVGAVALVLHILAAVQVTVANWRARPVGYVVRRDVVTGYAARTMIWSGIVVFLYLVYHLMMFTFLTTGPGYSETDVYRNVVLAFRVPAISAVYILAMVILGCHLYHGVWSMLQTLGFEWSARRRTVPVLTALTVAGGYILIPAAILTGLIR
jgi:succinate dehydrogenase / fumarate reductase cytochrome b subunit